MQIKTKLGSLALQISAEAKQDKADAIAALAAASLTYRAGGSALFGKKSGNSRDAAFSDKLAKDGIAAVEAALKPYFDGVKVEASAYVAPAKKSVEADRRLMRETLSGLLSLEEIEARVEAKFPTSAAEPSNEEQAGEEAVG